MVKEQLAPDNLRSALEAKLEKLIKLLKKVRKRLENAPKGTLRESKSHGTAQFYLLHEGKSKDGKYLKKNNDKALIQALSQKEHDLAAAKELTAEIKRLTRYLRYSEPSLSDAARKHLSPGKSALAEPLTLSDDEFAKRWLAEAYKTKGIVPGQRSFETACGIVVRSKSEAIIVEVLTAMHIPFRYEPELQLKAFTVHPDFLCLNVRTRQEIIWEHRGMMDETEYATKSVSRLIQYQNSGWILGRDLIITEETLTDQMDATRAKSAIMTYLI